MYRVQRPDLESVRRQHFGDLRRQGAGARFHIDGQLCRHQLRTVQDIDTGARQGVEQGGDRASRPGGGLRGQNTAK